jgi:hypothetical protein
VWGTKQNDLYKKQTTNFLAMREKMMTRKNFQDPNDLAIGVYKLSCKSSLPLRVPFGKDANFSALMKKMVPAPLMHHLTHKMFKKIFLK